MKLVSLVLVPVGLCMIVRDQENLSPEVRRSETRIDALESQSRESTNPQSQDWAKLDFGYTSFHINSVELETYAEPDWNLAKVRDFADRTKVTCSLVTDKTLLEIAQYGFSNGNCLRNIIQPSIRGGEGNAYLVGMLTITTDKREFKIGIGSTGFSINEEVPGCDTEFYSPAGAEFVNMIYCNQVGVPLRDEIVSALSGIRFIEMRRSTFRQLEYTKLLDRRLDASAQKVVPR